MAPLLYLKMPNYYLNKLLNILIICLSIYLVQAQQIVNQQQQQQQQAQLSQQQQLTQQQQQQPQQQQQQVLVLNNKNFVFRVLHLDHKENKTYLSLESVNPSTANNNQHEPRIELRYQSKHPFASIDERAPINTVVAAIIVSNDDGKINNEDFTCSIEYGNELGHFKLVSTQHTNTIQVAASPLSKQLVPEYNLTIVARDHSTPPKSSSTNLVIKVNTSAPLEPQPSLKPPVTDLMYFGLMLVVIFSALILILIIGCALVQRPSAKKGADATRIQMAYFHSLPKTLEQHHAHLSSS